MMKGFFWAGLGMLGARGIGWAVQIFLARRLPPEDFGALCLAGSVAAVCGVLRDLGLCQALIHARDERRAARAAFTMTVLSGLLLGGAMFGCGGRIAALLGVPESAGLFRIMAWVLAVGGLGAVPGALLEKRLDFRGRARAELIGAFALGAGTILLALRGEGIRSLACGQAAAALAGTGALWLFARWRPEGRFDPGEAKDLLKYGKEVLLGGLGSMVYTHLDNLVVGRFLGSHALGLYTAAYNLANLPALQIAHLIQRVCFPAYVALRQDRDRLGKAFLRDLRRGALAIPPLPLGMALAASGLLTKLYGPRWQEAAPLLRTLCLYGCLRAMGAAAGSLLLARGRPAWLFRLLLLQAALLVPALPLCLLWGGVKGVAIGFTGALGAGVGLTFLRAGRDLGIPIRDVLKAAGIPLLAGALAWAGAQILPPGCLSGRIGLFLILYGACNTRVRHQGDFGFWILDFGFSVSRSTFIQNLKSKI